MKTVDSLVAQREVYFIQMNMSVYEAANYMASKRVGAVPVLDGTRLVGIFSERDVITRVVARSLDPKTTKVESVMTKDLVIANSDESHESCLKKMQRAGCRHLPIVEKDKLIGVISLRDLLRIELDEKDEKIQFLHSYLFTVPGHAEKKYKT